MSTVKRCIMKCEGSVNQPFVIVRVEIKILNSFIIVL